MDQGEIFLAPSDASVFISRHGYIVLPLTASPLDMRDCSLAAIWLIRTVDEIANLEFCLCSHGHNLGVDLGNIKATGRYYSTDGPLAIPWLPMEAGGTASLIRYPVTLERVGTTSLSR